jgi:hypothetical protein
MKKVENYIAIKAISTIQLTEFVQIQIKEGYQPFYGISCSALTVDEHGNPTNTAVFCQAMVKYSNE